MADKITLDQVDMKVCEQYAQKWIANALSVAPMTQEERELCEVSARQLYQIAKLAEPKHIAFVPSPLTLCLAGPIGAGRWYLSRQKLFPEKEQPSAGADLPSNLVTRVATRAAVQIAVASSLGKHSTSDNEVILNQSIADVVKEMQAKQGEEAWIDALPGDSTDRVILAAVAKATYAGTVNAVEPFGNLTKKAAKELQDELVAGREMIDHTTRFLLKCCQHYYRMWQGGNQWSGWTSFLDYWTAEHGIKVNGEDVFSPYRELALHSGPRIVHEDFVLISDRPTVLQLDDQSRPHCESGPSHAWPDGWQLWYWHGVKVDDQIIMRPETQTVEQLRKEENMEVKRIRIERFGWERYLAETGAKVLDRRRNDVEQTEEMLVKADDDMLILVCHCPSTGRCYSLEVDPATVKTCEDAQKYLWSGSKLLEAAGNKLNIVGRS